MNLKEESDALHPVYLYCIVCPPGMRCVPHWAIRGVAPLRSALHSNRTFITRGLYFFGRCAGVLFPVALTPGAAYKASLRVQSERSAGVPPVSIRAGRSTSFRSALEPNIYYSRSILFLQKRLC